MSGAKPVRHWDGFELFIKSNASLRRDGKWVWQVVKACRYTDLSCRYTRPRIGGLEDLVWLSNFYTRVVYSNRFIQPMGVEPVKPMAKT